MTAHDISRYINPQARRCLFKIAHHHVAFTISFRESARTLHHCP